MRPSLIGLPYFSKAAHCFSVPGTYSHFVDIPWYADVKEEVALEIKWRPFELGLYPRLRRYFPLRGDSKGICATFHPPINFCLSQ